MSVKSKEEIITRISEKIGEDTSDEAIALMEDVADTLNEYEIRANGDGVDWKSEAERIDKEWREKYKSRFINSKDEANNKDDEKNDERKKSYSFEDLFEEKEN